MQKERYGVSEATGAELAVAAPARRDADYARHEGLQLSNFSTPGRRSAVELPASPAGAGRARPSYAPLIFGPYNLENHLD